MAPKLVFVLGLVVISFEVILGAPRIISSDKELETAVREFLSEDKEFMDTLEKASVVGICMQTSAELESVPSTSYSEPNAEADGLHGRARRQTELGDIDLGTADGVGGEGGAEGGFFDRAAKFVMDLLQRFLKWINTDSN